MMNQTPLTEEQRTWLLIAVMRTIEREPDKFPSGHPLRGVMEMISGGDTTVLVEKA